MIAPVDAICKVQMQCSENVGPWIKALHNQLDSM
jgi:hypothetical protein